MIDNSTTFLQPWQEEAVEHQIKPNPVDGIVVKANPVVDVVVCLSCGGTFTRLPDGSIPCGH